MTYLRTEIPSVTREQIAVAAGVSIATLTRRIREGFETGEIIRICRALDVDVVSALVELGHLTLDEVRRAAALGSLDVVTDRELLEELLGRTDENTGALSQADVTLAAYENDDLERHLEANLEEP